MYDPYPQRPFRGVNSTLALNDTTSTAAVNMIAPYEFWMAQSMLVFARGETVTCPYCKSINKAESSVCGDGTFGCGAPLGVNDG